VFHKTQIQQ